MENTALVNNLTNILNGLDDSQEKLEKDAFDVINSSDTSLNLVRESIGSVEHGRGFAVVASEVRNLASQSAKSSKEITDTINQVQHSVKETVSSMHEVYDNASAQKGKADSVGNLLKQVVDAAYAANEVARNIENEIAYQREITDEAKNALKA